MNYAAMARDYAQQAEQRQTQIVAYLQRLGQKYAGDLAAVEADKQRAFNDLCNDRNRYAQWSIMYSNLALLTGARLVPEPTPRQRAS